MGSHYTAGKLEGRYAGTIGDFGVYSFNGNKIITTDMEALSLRDVQMKWNI
ncbi:MAG: hypothetical protein ACLR7N_03805 [Roseburia hominis]